MDDAVKHAIDDMANALQTAVLVATRLLFQTATRADDAKTLEQALRRATQSLQRLQSRESHR